MQTGQTPRPLPKQPDIQTDTTDGTPSEPLISTTKRQGWLGQRGGQPQESPKKTQDKQQDQTQKQTNQQRGARASPPDHEATKHTRDATKTKQKTTETNHRSNRERKMPRDQTKGEPPRETVPRYNKHEFRMEEGQATSLNVRLTIETEEPNPAKSRIARGKSSPLRNETRQGGGKRRGGGGVVYAIRSIVLFW